MKPRELLLSILTAITLTTIVFFVMVIFLGVGQSNSFSENGSQLPNMGMPTAAGTNILGNDVSGNDISESISLENSVSKNNDVPEAELAADWCIDTVPGLMTVKYVIPDELPLCITEEYLDSNLKIIVKTYGGYHPEDGGINALSIWQPKTGLGGLVGIDWINKGPIPYDSDPNCPQLETIGDCELDVFWADFVLLEPIQVDSNHLPEVLVYGDADWTTLCDGTPSDNLDKWVFMSFVSSWEGCEEYDQKFKLILAHKNYFSKAPTSK